MTRCTEKTCAGKRCKKSSFAFGVCVSHSECLICQEKNTTSKPVIMKCGHAFHYNCIEENKKYSNNCPTCRMIIFKPKVLVQWNMVNTEEHRWYVHEYLLERYNNNTLPASLHIIVEEGLRIIDLEEH